MNTANRIVGRGRWALLALALVLSACKAKESQYPVIDSGVTTPGGLFGIATIAWIDDGRVLFKAVDESQGKSTARYYLSIWEVGNGFTRYTNNYALVNFCFQEGIIYRHQRDAQGNEQRFYGKFKEEKPIESPLYQSPPMTDVECNPFARSEVQAKRDHNRAVIPLLERHGFLETGAIRGRESLANDRIELHRRGIKEPLLLPLQKNDVGSLRYFRFKDAYFAPKVLGSYVITKKPAAAHWVYPDGHVEQVSIPIGRWASGTSTLLPVRTGILISAIAHNSPNDASPSGGYFVQPQGVKKVIDGFLDGAAVSPDGCKVAFSHSASDLTNGGAHVRRTLKLIDFCTKEGIQK